MWFTAACCKGSWASWQSLHECDSRTLVLQILIYCRIQLPSRPLREHPHQSHPKRHPRHMQLSRNTFFIFFLVCSISLCMLSTLHLQIVFDLITSSTAQGGGGSLKNRKPIGEIGCCECPGWQSEAYLPFSDYLATYLLTYLSMYVFIHWSLSLSLQSIVVSTRVTRTPHFFRRNRQIGWVFVNT